MLGCRADPSTRQQVAHAAGLKTGMVLFDVKGFFYLVNHHRMVGILSNLGFSAEIVEWVHAFLAHCKVQLCFNRITSEEREQPVGVPQGSPLSPVFSIIYMSGLLHKMKSWSHSLHGMYVNDGTLFACANEWAEHSGNPMGMLCCLQGVTLQIRAHHRA